MGHALAPVTALQSNVRQIMYINYQMDLTFEIIYKQVSLHVAITTYKAWAVFCVLGVCFHGFRRDVGRRRSLQKANGMFVSRQG